MSNYERRNNFKHYFLVMINLYLLSTQITRLMTISIIKVLLKIMAEVETGVNI